jgi:uncharacterized protein (TIGR03437 family)
MNSPHHISCDTVGYLYVADTGNNRVLVFPDPAGAGTPSAGERASASIGSLSSPEGIFVSPVTGEIWVTNTGGSGCPSGVPCSLRYANYQSVLLGLSSINYIAEYSGNFSYHPLAITEDQYGDLFVADDAQRVALYFPGLNVYNGASFAPIATRPLAPDAIASIFQCATCSGTQFLAAATPFSSYPAPTTLGNLQVLVDGTPSPLYYVSGNQINFIVPNGARTSGYADLQVVQASTGQILGAAQVPMYSVAPAAFLYPGGQTGATVYAAAINQDGTINSASNPAIHGQVISLYMTGQGNVPTAPPDGVQATTAISGQYQPTVLLNAVDVNSAAYGESSVQHVLYSGINQYPGMWQINVKIPATVATSAGVWFAVLVNGEANWVASSGFKTYIYVK